MIRVVHFTAPWCGPCKSVARTLAELAPTYPDVAFEEVDIDAEPTADVLALPTVLVLRDGELVARLEGARRRADYEAALAEVVPAGE